MDKAQLWQLIKDAHANSAGECEAQALALRTALKPLSAEKLIAFERIFNEYRKSAYRWDLWGAAVMLKGGSSDDGFEYFRCWLIGQGQTIFEGALADPDSLADLLLGTTEWGDSRMESESIAYAAGKVYEEKTGQEMSAAQAGFFPGEPAGMRWEEDDLDALYPRIAAKISEETMR